MAAGAETTFTDEPTWIVDPVGKCIIFPVYTKGARP